MKGKKENNVNKQKITELKRQKKQMEEELDELSGKTVRGKLMSILTFLLIMAVMAGVLVGMVKLNAGGVADNVLAPVIADVPVARGILPKRLQKKSASEIAAQKQAEANARATAEAQKKAKKQAEAQAKATAAAQKKAQEKARAQAQKQARATAEAKKAADLKDYADTYAGMDSTQAAAIFDNMMSDDVHLVAKILRNMPAKKRADIIANMNTLSAAQITAVMGK